jgi:hypothetical protein
MIKSRAGWQASWGRERLCDAARARAAIALRLAQRRRFACFYIAAFITVCDLCAFGNPPLQNKTGNYIDKKCPFTGNVSIRGRILSGAFFGAG